MAPSPPNDVIGWRDDEADPIVAVRSYDGDESLTLADVVGRYVVVVLDELDAVDAAW